MVFIKFATTMEGKLILILQNSFHINLQTFVREFIFSFCSLMNRQQIFFFNIMLY